MPDKSSASSVIIVGCGVFGLSTCIQLAKRGYQVTALDAFAVPSPWSAANDLSKIIRVEYSDLLYTKLAIEATTLWRESPSLKNMYHECGRILISPDSHDGRKQFQEKSVANLKIVGVGQNVRYFNNTKELLDLAPSMAGTNLPFASTGYFNPETGYSDAADSLVAVYNEAKRLGVEFIFGSDGKAVEIQGQNVSRPIVITASGRKHQADKVIVTVGAYADHLIDMKGQISAQALGLAHIKLSPAEFDKYKDMPIFFHAELGYTFPPDPETNIMKLCCPMGGITNIQSSKFRPDQQVSIPPYETDTHLHMITTVSHDNIRRLIDVAMPDLSHHRLFNVKTCWISDTPDSHFIIDRVPKCSNLYVAAGDSGHGFKFLPNIGKYIADRMEGILEPELCEVWQWREGQLWEPITWRIDVGEKDVADFEWVKDDSQRLAGSQVKTML